MKFKRGDIIRNRWAGEKNPTRFFVIWKIYGKRVSVVELINGRLKFEVNGKSGQPAPFPSAVITYSGGGKNELSTS